MTSTKTKRTKVLVELRPATEGFAGIPQETRLLFSGLRKLDGLDVEGLIQGPKRRLAKGTHPQQKLKWRGPIADISKHSKVVVSVSQKPHRTLLEFVAEWIRTRLETSAMAVTSALGIGTVRLTHFKSRSFEDFIWRTFFSKTLPASDFAHVTAADHRICSPSWDAMHRAGITSLNFRFNPKYPRLETKGVDIFVGQTPYPARIGKGTRLVIRYHDAIPVFMPHTINDKAHHQASHIYALKSNVESGAWFACVSEASRQDLLKMFPDVENRAVTIHNMVSHQYFDEETSFERVRGIIRSRIYGFDPDAKDLGITPTFLNLREQERFFTKHLFDKQFNYLLVVSTVEPRKNHTRVLAAWEVLKEEVDPNLKLVIVGTLGWEYKSLLKGLKTWIDRGELFMLNAVPSPDLRVLYKHAATTVCPSLGEGFDFAGVEAMRSGGIAVASDIPVHREIYDGAAQYFDPYSTRSLVDCLKNVLYDKNASTLKERLCVQAKIVSDKYTPVNILPQWEAFLSKVLASRR
jgi:glycosyltransferase involved in cell wall biosynthesis